MGRGGRNADLTVVALLLMALVGASAQGQQMTSADVGDDGSATAEASASGSGPVSASAVAIGGTGGGQTSASAVTSDDGEIGSAATATRPTPPAPSLPPRPPSLGTPPPPSSGGSGSSISISFGDPPSGTDDLPPAKPIDDDEVGQLDVCRGLSKWKCCDDEDFIEIDEATFCDCWAGSEGFCNFRILNKDPTVVVEDIFGFEKGQKCRCPEKGVTECIGITKTECCDNFDGTSDTCRCLFESCQFEKVSDKPLKWKDVSFNVGVTCTCPSN